MAALTDAMVRMIAEQRLCYVASVSREGYPALSPRGSLRVLDRSHLVFANADSQRTVENLSLNPRVEINVVDPFIRKGFRFVGKASIHRQGRLFLDTLDRFRNEGADHRRITSVTVVEIVDATPIISPVYEHGFSEDEVRRLWEEFHSRCGSRVVIDLVPPSDF